MKKIKNNGLQMSDLILYIPLLAIMVILNFTGSNAEPVSLALCFAMLLNDFNIPLTCVCYLISGLVSLTVSPAATIVFAAQAFFLLVAFSVNKKIKHKVKADGLIYAAIALLPFIFFSEADAYSFLPGTVFLQKILISAGILLLCGMFAVGLRALLFKVFRCRLRPEELIFIGVMSVVSGTGLYRMGGSYIYTGIALFAILFAAIVLKSPEAFLVAIAASIPQCVIDWNASYLASFVVYCAAAVFFSKEGKFLASAICFLSYLGVSYFYGVYAYPWTQMLFHILAGAVPCLIAVLIPKIAYEKIDKAIRSYREKQLSRVAINRNRSVIGEQLFEVSSLFRQIEGTFFVIGENSTLKEAQERLVCLVKREMCAACERRDICAAAEVDRAIDKLVAIGCAKGKVSLVDLPKEIATNCLNTGGLLFAINRQLKDYGKIIEENEIAESGRLLLAEQAHGISEVLKNIALEQSRPLNIYTEKERDVAEELARNGIVSSEILIYGEEDNLTVTLTIFGKYEASEVTAIVGKVLGFVFVLSDKISISHDKFSYILRRKTFFDAMFGVASKTKDGESVCGDTHSVIRIDERRFLVALADGSGSGEKARDVSDATVSLLESFYRAKMPSETILSTVNKLLTFTDDDSFSCLDLACVSLDDGSTDIVKLGAPLGFIFSETEIHILENESLPIGAVESLRPMATHTKLNENDVLVFLSDGVTSAFQSSAELFDFIKDFTPLNPQKLADDILNKAYELYGNEAKDDMTVVAVRLFRSAAA